MVRVESRRTHPLPVNCRRLADVLGTSYLLTGHVVLMLLLPARIRDLSDSSSTTARQGLGYREVRLLLFACLAVHNCSQPREAAKEKAECVEVIW
jgi:hypothetical protein